jgi:hypothetical protein
MTDFSVINFRDGCLLGDLIPLDDRHLDHGVYKVYPPSKNRHGWTLQGQRCVIGEESWREAMGLDRHRMSEVEVFLFGTMNLLEPA